MRTALMRWSTSKNLEPGEWVVVLDTKLHQCCHGLLAAYDPEDEVRTYFVRMGGAGAVVGGTWCTGNDEENLDPNVWCMVIGRVGMVDAKEWCEWSRSRVEAAKKGTACGGDGALTATDEDSMPAHINKRHSQSELPAIDSTPLWAVQLECTHESFNSGASIEALKAAHTAGRSAAKPKSSCSDRDESDDETPKSEPAALTEAESQPEAGPKFVVDETLVVHDKRFILEEDVWMNGDISCISLRPATVVSREYDEEEGYTYTVSFKEPSSANPLQESGIRESELFRL
eukprot:4716177-Prymnesium_polylepis.2